MSLEIISNILAINDDTDLNRPSSLSWLRMRTPWLT